MHCGSPYFATTNGRTFALFTVPERGERFSYEKHRIMIKEIALNEIFVRVLKGCVWLSGFLGASMEMIQQRGRLRVCSGLFSLSPMHWQHGHIWSLLAIHCRNDRGEGSAKIDRG